MKKPFVIIYSILVSIVLIFSITYFAVNIYNENAHGDLRTQLRFEKTVTGIKAAFEKNNISNSERSRLIENTIGDTNDFSYIKISNNNNVFYIFPEGYEEYEENTSKLVKEYKRSLNINGNRLEISTGLYTLKPSSIFDYAKTSFFIILIVTLLTIILIIYNNHFGTKESSKIKRIKIINEVQEDRDEAEEDYQKTEEDYQETTDEEILESDELSVEEDQALSEDNSSTAKVEELPVKDFEPVEIEEEKSDSEKGLFSPDTGLGWESYLLTRLENELNRATASELDLALFIIKLDGLGRKNPLMKKICEYLTVEFQFKDLLFEYKDDSICGIKISMDIDNAVSFGEKLVEEIKEIAKEESPLVLAGVTTRGIRMVTGERLLKEADMAVKHAAEDTNCPVVGFRADAVKYRKFLEKN